MRSVNWNVVDELVKSVECDERAVKNVIKLLEEENTIPFIARYRRDQTGRMEPEKIRDIKERYDDLKKVEAKALKAVKMVEKAGKLDKKLETSILNALDESIIEDLTAPFKKSSRVTKFQMALQLGLDQIVAEMLASGHLALNSLKRNQEGLSSLKDIHENLVYAMADTIGKEKDVSDHMVNFCRRTDHVFIVSRKINLKKTENSRDVNKFQEYFSFKSSVKLIKPHKYLAIKRGENLNFLKSTIELGEAVRLEFIRYCQNKYSNTFKHGSPPCMEVLKEGIDLSFEKIYSTRITSLFRNELKNSSEKASIRSFASNLKQLLMMKPVRNKHVLGVDPGFKNGCKYALINPSGEVLEVGVFYLSDRFNQEEAYKIGKLLLKHCCEVIAIGNGVGCRQTEEFFSSSIERGIFSPLNVSFSIVQEAGASVYSVSELAKEELPDIDLIYRGAVSIARRLQDPLVELIKIDPKSLGVGMYQHDISNSKLKSALDEVVEECVSFVGVDVNVCSEVLLKHVAGVGPSLAKKIVSKRKNLGGFKNRQQLLDVPGLGKKRFLQCAGFLRINSCPQEIKDKRTTSSSMEPKPKRLKKSEEPSSIINYFDRTSVHPESYDVARGLLKMAGLSEVNIGRTEFVDQLRAFIVNSDVENLSSKLITNKETLLQTIESLTQNLDSDIRDDFSEPFFKRGICSINSLHYNQQLTGQVTNITDFGAFVDIGVGMDALMHSSGIPTNVKVLVGERVKVRITNVDAEKKRINLALVV